MHEPITVAAEKLKKVAYETLLSFGIAEHYAEEGAKTLNAADLRGVDTHGVARLMFYNNMIKKGAINTNPDLKILKETPVSAIIDCDNGLGIAVAPIVADKAIELAKKSGIGIVVAKNGSHSGMSAFYSMRAAEQNLIGFYSQSTVPLAFPTGGNQKIIGNAPHSVAFPAGHKSLPMMYDMATSTVAGGKIEMAIRNGQKIPFGWVLDKDGNDTDDPKDFSMAPDGGSLGLMAGIKGYCISVMLELMSTVLPGAKINTEITDNTLGYVMIAIDPSIFRPIDELKDDLDKYYFSIKNSAKKEGVSEIYLPGEIEQLKAIDRKKNGIPVNYVVAQEVLALAKEYNRLPEDAKVEDLFE